jgi:tetratricopeptide (TPR) repeat protein
MDRLFALRTSDPQAFVAQTRSLDSLAPPVSVAQREFLQFLQANRSALEGRLAEAAERAKPLADTAEDPRLRLRAGAFVVNMLAGTREFEDGLRRLAVLLRAHPTPDPALLDEQRVLWATAAVLYNELGQHAMSVEYADRALSARPTPREACGMKTYKTMARLSLRDAPLAEADFDAADASAEEVVEGGRAVTVTASFGLSGTHEAGHDLQSLLDLSDRALYRAKNGGRDRVAAVDAA